MSLYEYLSARYPTRFTWDFLTGSISELKTGLQPTVVGSPSMPPGKGLFVPPFSGAGHYLNAGNVFNVTDTTAPWTIVVDYKEQSVPAPNAYMLFKVLGGVGFDIRRLSSGFTGVEIARAGVMGCFVPVPIRSGARQILVFSYNGGLKAAGVTATVNGVPTALSPSTDTLTAGDATTAALMSVGGLSAASTHASVIVHSLAWIDQQLTPAQMSDLYEYLATRRPARSRSYRRIPARFPGKTPSEYAAAGIVYDTDMSTVNGTLVDLSGGNRVGTPSGSIDTVEGPFGSQAKRFANGSYAMPADNTIFRTNDWTVSGWYHQPSTPSGTRYFFGRASSVHYCGPTTLNRFYLATRDAALVTRVLQTTSFVNGKFTHFAASRALVGADLVLSCWVDGALVGTATYAGAGVEIPVGATTPFSAPGDGTLAQLRYRTTAMTAAEAREEYLAGDRTILDARLERTGATPVTPVAVTGAQQMIPGTPWKTNAAGNWKVIEAAPVGTVLGKRTISYSTSGDFIYARDTEAFGAWFVEIKPTGTFGQYANVVANSASATVTTQGYAIQLTATGQVQLGRTTGAVFTVILSTAAAYVVLGNTYSFMLTRNILGVFTLWIKGGVYTEYTLVSTTGGAGSNPTAADLTYTTSKYAILNRNGGTGEYGDYVHRSCEMTPQEAQAEGLITGVPTYYQIAGDFTTTKTSQSWTMKFVAGTQFYVDWGDGFVSPFIATGADQVITHTYAGAGTYTVRWFTTTPANLQTFNGSGNQLAGTIPSFAASTGLVTLRLDNNSFTAYTSGAIALTCTTWRADINALPQASVDAALADMATNIGLRPVGGTMDLSGGTNAAPSAAGLVNKAIIAARPWTCTTT